MRLDVIGSPTIGRDSEQQFIKITHTSRTDITTIVCEADIVTTGIAIHVLQEKYEEIKKRLSPEDQLRLHTVIAEAVAR